jgi:hypothetical protein
MSKVYATDWSWSPLMADFDLDGHKDLFVSSGIVKRTVDLDFINYLNNIKILPGQDPRLEYDKAIKKMPDGSSHNFYFKGSGNENFLEQSEEVGFEDVGFHTGAAYADLDNDGDLDIVVNPINKESFVYQNNTSEKSFLSIKLKGNYANTSALGTRIWCYSKFGVQYLESQQARGFQSSSNDKLIFGLSKNKEIDSLLIVWNNGDYEVIQNPIINQQLTITQKNNNKKFIHQLYFPRQKPPFEEDNDSVIQWSHSEDKYNDFEINNLQHHQLSTLGPKLITEDLNKDGYDDVFICGGSGQSSALFISKNNNSFQSTNKDVFSIHASYEDNAAIFSDVDGDDFKDLIVVSSGYSQNDGLPHTVRLYQNDGKNNFNYKAEAIPSVTGNISCVSSYDYDFDGDEDLFIGKANAATSMNNKSLEILKNDGKGNFTVVEKILDVSDINQVFDISIDDINNDKKSDIVVTQSWGPIVVYFSENKGYKKKLFSESGMWKKSLIVDIDGDGDKDILSGNLGSNSKLSASNKEPIYLYTKDFDNNGSIDELLATTKSGVIYPFYNKDVLEKTLPFIRKKYNLFHDFAGQPLDKIFDLKNAKQYIINQTCSGIYINDGKANFTFNQLPSALQHSPIYDICQVDDETYLFGGNFSGVQPYEGRYDGASLIAYLPKHNNTYLLSTKGEVRSIVSIKTTFGSKILTASNNGQLKCWKKR